jgi:hypothetical protein
MGSPLTFCRFVLIVAEVQDTSADEVEPAISRSEAEAALTAPFGGPDEFVLYAEPVEQAALCCAAIIRHRPLPSDNKRVAYKCMLEMLVRYPRARIDPEPQEIAAMLDGLGDETIGEEQFVDWVYAQVGICSRQRYQDRWGDYGLGGTRGSPSP